MHSVSTQSKHRESLFKDLIYYSLTTPKSNSLSQAAVLSSYSLLSWDQTLLSPSCISSDPSLIRQHVWTINLISKILLNDVICIGHTFDFLLLSILLDKLCTCICLMICSNFKPRGDEIWYSHLSDLSC